MTFIQRLFAGLIQAAHSDWHFKSPDSDAGYTALVPVPADLPVFTKIALHNIFSQDPRHMTEALVIPDQPSAEYRKVFQDIVQQYPQPPITVRLVEMSAVDRWIGKASSGGNTYHFLQLINGIEHSRGQHVLFHDADLFLPPGDILCKRFEEFKSRGTSVFAVNPRQSKYNEECTHFVATWEMLATKDWLRRFRPHQMRGQTWKVNGKHYGFDTTHLPQFLSDPDEIQHTVLEQAVVHFNYIITNYRIFNKSPKPFTDNGFKLFFIRLLVDALDDSGWPYRLPSMDNFVAGLSGSDESVSYVDPEAEARYPAFRQKLQELMELGLYDQEVVAKMAASVAPFDDKFRWNRMLSSGAK